MLLAVDPMPSSVTFILSAVIPSANSAIPCPLQRIPSASAAGPDAGGRGWKLGLPAQFSSIRRG
jgi:hypothetical protein